MHQTFYIDIDEEITSIIDRLRKAGTKEIVIVVPKRALLIQSIVNLKLLKKEAEKLRKEIVIVTQDKLGKLLVEKTGIAAEQKLDDIEGEEVSAGERPAPLEMELKSTGREEEIQKRLESIGSPEYFKEKQSENSRTVFGEVDAKKEDFEDLEAEKITNRELVKGVKPEKRDRRSFLRKSPSMDIMKNVDVKQAGNSNLFESPIETSLPVSEKKRIKRVKSGAAYDFSEEATDGSDRVRDFFSRKEGAKHKHKDKTDYESVDLSGRFWRILLGFGIVALIIVVLAGAYLFLPKADIKIFAKAKNRAIDVQIKGDPSISAVNTGNLAIPAKMVAADVNLTENFSTTGDKSATDQEARGTLTVYNEYSNSPQPLVATTRFQTSDGKIFRLIRGVVVPGTTNINGEIKQGAIEAEVIADQPGDAYNIGPTNFTIPGFQGNSGKYSKFYAKSFKAMAGGKSGEATLKSVAAGDIAGARNLLASKAVNSARQKLADSAGPEAVVLDDAVNIGNITYSFSSSEGEMADNFSGTAKFRASAIVFERSDAFSVALNKINENADDNSVNMEASALTLEFGKADADFAGNSILIRVHASGKTVGRIDLENLKKGVLGKSEDEFKSYLKSYPQIESAEISYRPSFLGGRIPTYESRVDMTLGPAPTLP